MRFDVDVFCLDLSQDVALLCFAFTGCLGGQMHVEESAASIKLEEDLQQDLENHIMKDTSQ